MGYFQEDAETKEDEAAKAEHELLFGYDAKVSDRERPSLVLAAPRIGKSGLLAHPKYLDETADAVARLAGEVSAGRLAEELTISLEAARLRLSRACNAGLLKRTAPGKYMTSSNSSFEQSDISF
jgi:hypothetical protein